jgi:imidazolonepropionase-like amidohydrolase
MTADDQHVTPALQLLSVATDGYCDPVTGECVFPGRHRSTSAAASEPARPAAGAGSQATAYLGQATGPQPRSTLDTGTSPRALAIRTGHLFDGDRVHGRALVLVRDGRITDVDLTGAQPPSGLPVIDLGADGWLLPGLVDAHVHLTWDGTANAVVNLMAGSDDDLRATIQAAAHKLLAAGVTTVRDLGDRGYLTVEHRQNTPPHATPHIVAAGPPLTTPGGHCHFLGGAVDGADQIRAAVRARADNGCEVVKVMATGGNLTPGSAAHQSQFTAADLRLVVNEARLLGLRVAAHAHAADGIVDAVRAGVDTLEHFSFFTADGVEFRPQVLDELLSRGTVVSATVGILPGSPPPPPPVARRLDAIIALMRRTIAAGVPVIAGTDAGVDPLKPHDILPYGLAQLGELGMPAVEVLRSGTRTAAAAVGLAGRKGVVSAGADADMLALGADPTWDLAALRDVRAVFRAGVRVR